MKQNTTISYKVEKCYTIKGGLNFQIVTKMDDMVGIDLEKIEYGNSIAISENAFAIIENIFTSELPVEDRKNYHWEFHYHDINSVHRIILKLNALKRSLGEQGQITFLWKSSDLLKNLNELEVINQGLIKLAWSTDEIIDELHKNIVYACYRKQIVHFINEIIDFLKNGVSAFGCRGIYVLGV